MIKQCYRIVGIVIIFAVMITNQALAQQQITLAESCVTPTVTLAFEAEINRYISKVQQYYATHQNPNIRQCGVNNVQQLFGVTTFFTPTLVGTDNQAQMLGSSIAESVNGLVTSLQINASSGAGVQELWQTINPLNWSHQHNTDIAKVRDDLLPLRELLFKTEVCDDGTLFIDELTGTVTLSESVYARYMAYRQLYYFLLAANRPTIKAESVFPTDVLKAEQLMRTIGFDVYSDLMLIALYTEPDEGYGEVKAQFRALADNTLCVDGAECSYDVMQMKDRMQEFNSYHLNPFYTRKYFNTTFDQCIPSNYGVDEVMRSIGNISKESERFTKVLASFSTVVDDMNAAINNVDLKARKIYQDVAETVAPIFGVMIQKDQRLEGVKNAAFMIRINGQVFQDVLENVKHARDDSGINPDGRSVQEISRFEDVRTLEGLLGRTLSEQEILEKKEQEALHNYANQALNNAGLPRATYAFTTQLDVIHSTITNINHSFETSLTRLQNVCSTHLPSQQDDCAKVD